jgi:GntR family transcriptional regulator, arabinose operon transcriptional repressor
VNAVHPPGRGLKSQRLAIRLREAIASRAYPPGGRLPTEQEIAAANTVSLTTVRRAMEILAAEGLVIRRQGSGTYVAEQPAPTRRHPDARAVGVVVPDTTMYFPRVLEGIEETLTRAGVGLMLVCSRYEVEADERAVTSLLEAGVAGLLLVPTLIERSDPAAYVAQLNRVGVPVILVERALDPSGPSDTSEYVRTDHEAGGYQAVTHLAELGHRRLGLVLRGGSPTSKPVEAGFLRATAELGLEIAEQIAVPRTSWQAGQADPALRALVDAGATGVVCLGDREATMLVSAARRAGVVVPGQLAIVAYDDDIADLADVPLTAVSPPKYHLGRLAAELLLRRLAEPELPPHQVRLRPSIVVRESSGSKKAVAA